MFHFGTNHANGGTASCRSAVFFGLEEEGRGRRGWKRTRRGRERESGRMGEDLEEDGKGTRRMGEDFEEEEETGL